MTSKLTRQATSAPGFTGEETFPDFPPRDDMQNYIYLNRPGHPGALDRRYGLSNATVILSEAPLRWSPGQQQGHRIPDLLVAFEADRELAVRQRGYSIQHQGKPPDFVMEIASPTTGREDYTAKREDYAAFGVTEYWRFDSSGGQHYDAPLAGDRLVNGEYQSIEIERTDPSRLWGRSQVLNLDLCWEDGRLRWWDPETESYLLTFDETDEARVNAEARADSAEARADREREARVNAEARVRELEAELERRRQS